MWVSPLRLLELRCPIRPHSPNRFKGKLKNLKMRQQSTEPVPGPGAASSHTGRARPGLTLLFSPVPSQAEHSVGALVFGSVCHLSQQHRAASGKFVG